MSKSVFISSTSFDLTDYREAVDKAIRRLKLRPINMTDFGSQPGGATGVSLSHVGEADIFVGIIARRYGFVPDGQSLSVTEQEYDEAVRRKLPRLMYLLDPKADWPSAYIETAAQDKLDTFRAKIERTDVRSLFTSPDALASQVTADLTNLLEKQRRTVLITRGLAVIVVAMALIALVLIADSGIRTPVLVSMGILTQTSSPTTAPLPTATPLDGKPFAENQVGLVFANLKHLDSDASNVEDNLDSEMRDTQFPYIHVRHTLAGRDEARQVGNLYNATIVMWGEIARGGVRIFFEIMPRRSEVDTTLTDLKVATTELTSFDAYLFQGMDTLYIINFIAGQIAFFDGDYVAALSAFDQSISKIPLEREVDLKVDALYFYRANVYYQQGKIDLALADYDRAIRFNPQLAEAYNNRGNLLRSQGKLDAAITDYNQAISLNPQLAAIYSNRGLTLSDQGKLDAAITDYNQAIKLDPRSAIVYQNRGNAFSDQGKLDAAIADYNQAISLNPQLAEAYQNRGNVLSKEDKLDEAITDYNQAIKLDPQFATAYFNRGRALTIRGNLDTAIADYNQAIKLDPHLSIAYTNRGVALSDQGKLDAAVADYTQAISLNSLDAEAYYNRGNALSKQGKLKAAIDDYTQAIALNPQIAQAYLNRGIILHQQGKLDAAVADYTQAISLNPQLTLSYINRGSILSSQGKLEEAITDYAHAIELDSQYPAVYFESGILLRRQGKLDEAIANYTHAIELNSRYTDAYINRGNILFDQGKLDEAIADYTRAIEIDPQHADSYNDRGAVLMAQSKAEAAIADFKTAIAINPLYANAYGNLGQVLDHQNKFAEALQNYQKYLQLAGDNPSSFVVDRVHELVVMLKTATPSPTPSS
ncbi:MAG: tetratricopeptide repeat protein [Anaerolineaceae bacterium]|nr:tetratricopeptide repeat protein [Anaerolineaceae bacterium]